MGLNTLRDRPLDPLSCVGFVREYHDWSVDEGSNLYENCWTNESGSDPYPNNLYRWTEPWQGATPTSFDFLYQNYNGMDRQVVSAMMNNTYANLGLPTHPQFNAADPVDEIDCDGDGTYEFCYHGMLRTPNPNYVPGASPCSNDPATGAWVHSNAEFLYGSPVPYLDMLPLQHEFNPDNNRFQPLGCTPISLQNGTIVCEEARQPASYIGYADWMTQFAARYAEFSAFPDEHLKVDLSTIPQLAPDAATVHYFELWNEQDKFWHKNNNAGQMQFQPEEYAAMASMVYDGHNEDYTGQGPNGTYPLGIEHVDENAGIVFGGLYQLDFQFVEDVHTWLMDNRSDANEEDRFFFDVINFHHYSYRDSDNDDYDQGIQKGWWISPEEDRLRCRLSEIRDWAESIGIGDKEFWLSEFGYDDAQFNNSINCNQGPGAGLQCWNGPDVPNLSIPYGDVTEYQHASTTDTRQIVADWTIRAYLEIAAAGFDRGMPEWSNRLQFDR